MEILLTIVCGLVAMLIGMATLHFYAGYKHRQKCTVFHRKQATKAELHYRMSNRDPHLNIAHCSPFSSKE